LGRKPFFVGFVKIGIVNRLGPPMNRSAGNPKVRLLTGFAAVLLSGFVAVSVLSLMYSEYPAIGGMSLLAFALVLLPLLAVSLVFCRGRYRAFCMGAAIAALFAFYSAISALVTLFKNLPPTWPPTFADFDEQRLIEANEYLGTAVLASIALGYFCVAVVWLAERLRQAGVRTRPQFGLKTVFILTTIAGFAASVAARISPANQMQFYFIAFCAGCVAIVAFGLYIAAILVPPIQIRGVGRRSIKTQRLPHEE
jgi:hypothetical protein